jgi:hypothetical protein
MKAGKAKKNPDYLTRIQVAGVSPQSSWMIDAQKRESKVKNPDCLGVQTAGV